MAGNAGYRPDGSAADLYRCSCSAGVSSRSGSLQKALLRANSDVYESLLAAWLSLDADQDPERWLRDATDVAIFASMFHPGRFTDSRLENPVLDAGRRLAGSELPRDLVALCAPLGQRRRVVHLTSRIELGGHAPFIAHWIAADTESDHRVVMTDQRDSVPTAWAEAVTRAGAKYSALETSSQFQKAAWLREIARRGADLVIWHVTSPEVVPILAFGAAGGPPVIGVDHNDHIFWPGSSVMDMVVCLRTLGEHQPAARRFARRTALVPVPLTLASGTIKGAAREELGIPGDEIVLLTVGRGVKYRPCGTFNFLKTAGRILDRSPGTRLYVAGESETGIRPYLDTPAHDRIRFLGTLGKSELEHYRAAADLYLETFPFGSQTALLEAGLAGLPIVPACAPLAPMLVAYDDAIADLLPNPDGEGEYVKRALELIEDSTKREKLGGAIRTRLAESHVGAQWFRSVEAIYDCADTISHEPAELPESEASDNGEDHGLCMFGAMTDARFRAAITRGHEYAGLTRYRAYLAKHIGDYGKAFRLAIRALRLNWFERESWRLLVVAGLGPAGRVIRRWSTGRKGG